MFSELLGFDKFSSVLSSSSLRAEKIMKKYNIKVGTINDTYFTMNFDAEILNKVRLFYLFIN